MFDNDHNDIQTLNINASIKFNSLIRFSVILSLMINLRIFNELITSENLIQI